METSTSPPINDSDLDIGTIFRFVGNETVPVVNTTSRAPFDDFDFDNDPGFGSDDENDPRPDELSEPNNCKPCGADEYDERLDELSDVESDCMPLGSVTV